MKTLLLPFLGVTAFVGAMSLPVHLGAAVMLLLTAGMGAIILQDYSCQPRLALRGRRLKAKAVFPSLLREANRLAA